VSGVVNDTVIPLAYLFAAGCFVLALKWLSHPTTASRGVRSGEIGMLVAVVATLFRFEIVEFRWIAVAVVAGIALGAPLGLLVPMTAVPQRTALSHAFGALAAGLVGTAEYYLEGPDIDRTTMLALGLEVVLGFLTVTGSLVAAAKLQGIIGDRPWLYAGQNLVNLSCLVAALTMVCLLVADPGLRVLFPLVIVVSLAFGVMLVTRIGGADMPTVISLLNSYAGLSAAMMGYVLGNKLLIVAGALDGSSGLFLSIVMCRAMNRSFTNVLFGGFGATRGGDDVEARPVRAIDPEETAFLLDAARTVVIVPGYGMAAAQAQHKTRRAERPPAQARGRCALRHPPGGRTHARSHERPPRRGRRPLRPALRARSHQPRASPDRRRAGRGSQRRRVPRRPERPRQPDLRDAHPRRRRGHVDRRREALDASGVRLRRERAVLPGQDPDALRRRQAGHRRGRRRAHPAARPAGGRLSPNARPRHDRPRTTGGRGS
jgi:NAD(P) transhydrogenase subunit beta